MSSSIINLIKECEYRFEIDENETFSIKLLSGTAEIFGVELVKEKIYHFTDTRLGVFTWYGCSLEVTGTCRVSYVSEDTPMVLYMNIHVQLEKTREDALKELRSNEAIKTILGPRVLVAGPIDSGKSTLCDILLNYAIRLGHKPTYVDLDISTGQLSIPGSAAAIPLDSHSMSIEDKFHISSPLVYYYGSTELSNNPEYYKFILEKLAEAVNERALNDMETNVSGFIIKAPSVMDALSTELLMQIIRYFDINCVLVIGHDRLYSEISALMRQEKEEGKVSLVKLPRSGGIIPRNMDIRRRERLKQIKGYYYGKPKYIESEGRHKDSLSPYTTSLDFNDIVILKIIDLKTSNMILPVGHDQAGSSLRVVPVEITQDITHSILGVWSIPQGKEPTEDDYSLLLGCNVAGFLYVKNVNLEERTISLFSPCPGALPSKYLMLGGVKWME